MQVDGTILHGWLLLCALSAFILVEHTLPPGISQPLHLISAFFGLRDAPAGHRFVTFVVFVVS
jgi:hypothetical protein